MDLYKKKRQGILHFANSIVNRGDENRPFERLLVMSNNTLPLYGVSSDNPDDII
jgi:hypothetical protein